LNLFPDSLNSLLLFQVHVQFALGVYVYSITYGYPNTDTIDLYQQC